MIMSLVLGLASSHAPTMFLEAEKWPVFYKELIRQVPQPSSAETETPEVIQEYIQRIRRDFDILAKKLEEAQIDVLIMVGDDQGEVFSDPIVPLMNIYLGEEISGTLNLAAIGEPLAENHISFRCHPQLAQKLLEGLVAREFDISYSKTLVAMGKPEGGLGHAFTRPGKALRINELNIPIIPFFLNTYHPPLASAKRCLDLGRAIREVVEPWKERVAIYASGGLSHDPRGPRAGWIDEPLDRWVLEQISSGNNQALGHLFTFDSDTLRGGTGEIRTWIVAAGAFEDYAATVVDYFPVHHAVTGLGFAYWEGGQQ
jgi:protocatechuate 4,5-dioxygenase beta chain